MIWGSMPDARTPAMLNRLGITVTFTHPTYGGVIEADIAYADPAFPGPTPQVRTHHVLQRINCL